MFIKKLSVFLDTASLGTLLLQMRGGATHTLHMRIREIQQESLAIHDLENEPGHVWTRSGVSGVTRNDI